MLRAQLSRAVESPVQLRRRPGLRSWVVPIRDSFLFSFSPSTSSFCSQGPLVAERPAYAKERLSMHGVRGEGVGAVIRTKSRRPEGAGQLDYERPARALQRWKSGEEETGKR